jgi:hypothetical protein
MEGQSSGTPETTPEEKKKQKEAGNAFESLFKMIRHGFGSVQCQNIEAVYTDEYKGTHPAIVIDLGKGDEVVITRGEAEQRVGLSILGMGGDEEIPDDAPPIIKHILGSMGGGSRSRVETKKIPVWQITVNTQCEECPAHINSQTTKNPNAAIAAAIAVDMALGIAIKRSIFEYAKQHEEATA